MVGSQMGDTQSRGEKVAWQSDEEEEAAVTFVVGGLGGGLKTNTASVAQGNWIGGQTDVVGRSVGNTHSSGGDTHSLGGGEAEQLSLIHI